MSKIKHIIGPEQQAGLSFNSSRGSKFRKFSGSLSPSVNYAKEPWVSACAGSEYLFLYPSGDDSWQVKKANGNWKAVT